MTEATVSKLSGGIVGTNDLVTCQQVNQLTPIAAECGIPFAVVYIYWYCLPDSTAHAQSLAQLHIQWANKKSAFICLKNALSVRKLT